jgi:hypothetical protein
VIESGGNFVGAKNEAPRARDLNTARIEAVVASLLDDLRQSDGMSRQACDTGGEQRAAG